MLLPFLSIESWGHFAHGAHNNGLKGVNKMHTPELYCLDIKRSSPNHFRSLGSEVLEISLFSGPALLEDGVLAALPFPNL